MQEIVRKAGVRYWRGLSTYKEPLSLSTKVFWKPHVSDFDEICTRCALWCKNSKHSVKILASICGCQGDGLRDFGHFGAIWPWKCIENSVNLYMENFFLCAVMNQTCIIRALPLGGHPIGNGFVRPSICLSVNTGSDTINWVVFNVQLSYFLHRCRMARGRYLYILGSKVKVTTELCQHFGSDMITWVVFNVQLSYLIHRRKMARVRYLYILGSKGLRSRSQRNFVNTLVLKQ